MLQLASKAAATAVTTHLTAQQAVVNQCSTFDEKVSRANSLWKTKALPPAGVGEAAFRQVKADLTSMCVSVEICNYCENNEATDIEHIFPKSSFPELAFAWENYILACRTCNTDYKSDDFAVFNPAQSGTLQELAPRSRPRLVPPTVDNAFITPRTEDPMHFLWLDIIGDTFGFDKHPLLTSPRDEAKAIYTIELLKLSERPALLAARKKAFQFYRDRLRDCAEAEQAKSHAQLARLVARLEPDHEQVDHTKPLRQEQDRVIQAIRRAIQTNAHPTVWHEMKRQRQLLPAIDRWFAQAPVEALTW
jgi:hypothetical protein